MTIHGGVFVSYFSIELDKPPVYFAGETVRGKVLLHVNHPIYIRGLFIQIKGDCNVHWTEKCNGYKAEPRHYRNYQQCLGWSHFFLGNPRTVVKLEPGAHEFEFNYTLPRKIPSSFEGSHGNIRYFVMSQLDWPGGNHFQQTLQCITVNSIFDLNLSPDTKSSEERKTEHHQVLLRRSLKTTLNVPRKGFVPGQTVTAFASVDNKTMHSVISSKTELVEVCKYQACDQEQTTKRVVAKCKRGPIPRGTKDTWHVMLDIPPIPPSGLVYCHIIHLEYYIKLTVETVRLPKQKLQIPLIIGTIPLKEDADQFEDELDTIAESLQEAFGRKAPSMQFAESVWGKTELNTNQRRVSQAGNSFTPNYVLYKRTSTFGGHATSKTINRVSSTSNNKNYSKSNGSSSLDSILDEDSSPPSPTTHIPTIPEYTANSNSRRNSRLCSR
ncbi:arrestin domain-containing protein 2-like isoform X2 [Bolinopsis microptera]|uniref:arrestin domain-containing protein 2-like isoform X2 n=1 Tax=Bolinopsis microptera TaxID=2820187 RepID=UPI00307A1B1D